MTPQQPLEPGIPVLTDVIASARPAVVSVRSVIAAASPTIEVASPTIAAASPAAPASPALPALARQRDLAFESDTLVAELQTKLSSRAFALTEDLLRTAFAEMEASIFEQITAKLRRELPELIDATLREHLGSDDRS